MKSIRDLLWREYYHHLIYEKGDPPKKVLANFQTIEPFVDYLEGNGCKYAKKITEGLFESYNQEVLLRKVEQDKEILLEFLGYLKYIKKEGKNEGWRVGEVVT